MDRTIHATEVAKTLRRAIFGESRGGIPNLSTVVPASVAYREAAPPTVGCRAREGLKTSTAATSAAAADSNPRGPGKVCRHAGRPTDSPILCVCS